MVLWKCTGEKMLKEKPKVKRLSIDIPLELHQGLKITAAKYNMTISKLIHDVIFTLINNEKQRDESK